MRLLFSRFELITNASNLLSANREYPLELIGIRDQGGILFGHFYRQGESMRVFLIQTVAGLIWQAGR